MRTNYIWSTQRRTEPIYRKPDPRSFPKLTRGSCFNCQREKKVQGSMTCERCDQVLQSFMLGCLAEPCKGVAGVGDRDGPVGEPQ